MTDTPCVTCGEAHVAALVGGRACKGHSTRTGKPCRKNAMDGQDVCRTHGGGAPQAKAAAERQIAEQQTIAAARKLIPDLADRAPIVNPLERLLEIASELDAFRESLRVLSNNLEDKIRYKASGAGTEQLRAEIGTYRVAARDVTDLLIAIARLNIDERLSRITEQQASRTLAALDAGMSEAGLDETVKRGVMAGVGRHLRVVNS